MLTRSVAALAACLVLWASHVEAGFVVQGFSYTRLAPTLPGGNFGAISQAVNPVTGDVWTSDGQTLRKLGPNDEWNTSESILQKDGGPVRNTWVTTSMVFDVQGRMYINDFGNGAIYRRENDGSPWELFAQSYSLPRVMHFDSTGNLVIVGNNNSPYRTGLAWSIDPNGTITDLGATQGESFAFGPDGSLIIPVYEGGGIDRLNADGSLDHLFQYEGLVEEWESIAITSQGNYIIGVNTFFDWELDRNTSKIIRVNGVTGERELIAVDLDLSIPVEMSFEDGDLAILGYGSVHTGTARGDFDGPLIPLAQTPEPSTLTLSGLAVGGFLLLFRRRRRYLWA